MCLQGYESRASTTELLYIVLLEQLKTRNYLMSIKRLALQTMHVVCILYMYIMQQYIIYELQTYIVACIHTYKVDRQTNRCQLHSEFSAALSLYQKGFCLHRAAVKDLQMNKVRRSMSPNRTCISQASIHPLKAQGILWKLCKCKGCG